MNQIVLQFLLVLGATSYAVYMLHWLIITFIRYQLVYAWNYEIDLTSPVNTAAILFVVFAVSVPVYYLFELPAKKAVKKWASSN